MQYKSSKEQLELIRDIFETSQKENLLIFIKGGWNIDLAFGKQTREHEDIDFHYNIADKKFWEDFFAKKGFKKDEKDEWQMQFSKKGIQVDFEGFKISKDIITWKAGNKSKAKDVYEDRRFPDFVYKGMKLGVEKYLKERFVKGGYKMRRRDKHDLDLLGKVEGSN